MALTSVSPAFPGRQDGDPPTALITGHTHRTPPVTHSQPTFSPGYSLCSALPGLLRGPSLLQVHRRGLGTVSASTPWAVSNRFPEDPLALLHLARPCFLRSVTLGEDITVLWPRKGTCIITGRSRFFLSSGHGSVSAGLSEGPWRAWCLPTCKA